MNIEQFLRELTPPFTGFQLFDCLFDIVFFIKDAEGRYLEVNTTLVERCGEKSKDALRGKRADQVLRPPLGNIFSQQDQLVLKSGKPLLSRLELHLYADGQTGWCLTTKLPLQNRAGEISGLVGVSQDMRLPDYQNPEYKRLATAIKHAQSQLDQPQTVSQLAAIAEMSAYQLDRRMKRIFGLTTGQWLIKLRLDLAQNLLAQTKKSIASIALATGYADQSAFTRQFKKATGLSPREFRNLQQATRIA